MKKMAILLTLLIFKLNSNLTSELSKVMPKSYAGFLTSQIKTILENNTGIEAFDAINNVLKSFEHQCPGLEKFLTANKNNLIGLIKDLAKTNRPEIYKNLTQEQLNNKLVDIILNTHSNYGTNAKDAEKLIMAGADPNLIIDLINEKCPLIVYICKSNKFLNLLDLFKIYNVDINAKAENGSTAIMSIFNCQNNNPLVLADKILELNPDLTIENVYGHNVLTYAIKYRPERQDLKLLGLIKEIAITIGLNEFNKNLLKRRKDYKFYY